MSSTKRLLITSVLSAILLSGCVATKVGATTVGVAGQAAKTTIKMTGAVGGAVIPTRPKEQNESR